MTMFSNNQYTAKNTMVNHGFMVFPLLFKVVQSSDKSCTMPFSEVCDTKMSMLDFNSKKVICPSIQGKDEGLCF